MTELGRGGEMNIRVLAEALADKVDDRQSQELLDHPSFTRDGLHQDV